MINAREIRYADAGAALAGELCWPDGDAPRPGLLLVHGGAGLDEHASEQARRYAALGYAVLACDMYGAGIAGDRDRVMAMLLRLRDDPAALAARADAGLRALRGCPEADGARAAVGFCSGGMAALALARSGAPLAAVISMHGSLATPAPARPGSITARLLICHGAQDPHVPMTDVSALAAELTAAGADWQCNIYGTAMHGFTHAGAVPGAVPGVAYDAAADERSFAAASDFLARSLTTPGHQE